jgi:3-phosphoshikimate 1-carboxyvinyltransferase
MTVMVYPNNIKGSLNAIPAKAHGHRLFIASALSHEKTLLELHLLSRDLEATLGCLEALGSGTVHDAKGIWITPLNFPKEIPVLDCGESGSTLRFLLPIAAALVEEFEMRGTGRLPDRPLGELKREMMRNGCRFSSNQLPFRVRGPLDPGKYQLPGDVSSQYITGLLMALPLLRKDSVIEVQSPLESAGYVEMTLDVLKAFGIAVRRTKVGFKVPGNQRYHSPGKVKVEGDWSNGAFFLAMGAIQGEVKVEGLEKASLQPDRKILAFMEEMGAKLTVSSQGVLAKKSPLKAIKADISACPDLMPVLSVLMANATGISEIMGGKRLRFKESDRIRAMKENLSGLGVQVEEKEDGLKIWGNPHIRGGAVQGYNDHRIVMAMATAACNSKAPILITDHDAVEKSYPNFFLDLKNMGGEWNVL